MLDRSRFASQCPTGKGIMKVIAPTGTNHIQCFTGQVQTLSRYAIPVLSDPPHSPVRPRRKPGSTQNPSRPSPGRRVSLSCETRLLEHCHPSVPRGYLPPGQHSLSSASATLGGKKAPRKIFTGMSLSRLAFKQPIELLLKESQQVERHLHFSRGIYKVTEVHDRRTVQTPLGKDEVTFRKT